MKYFRNLSERVSKQINIYGRPHELTILLVCSKKCGINFFESVLYDVEQYAIDNGIYHIILEPINDYIKEYYKKFGFYNYKTNKKMIKNINIKFSKSNLKKTLKKK